MSSPPALAGPCARCRFLLLLLPLPLPLACEAWPLLLILLLLLLLLLLRGRRATSDGMVPPAVCARALPAARRRWRSIEPCVPAAADRRVAVGGTRVLRCLLPAAAGRPTDMKDRRIRGKAFGGLRTGLDSPTRAPPRGFVRSLSRCYNVRDRAVSIG